MIRSLKKLRAALDEGFTVCAFVDGRGRTLHLDSGELICGPNIGELVEKGELVVLARDLCGDPMQWGRQ